MLRGQQEKVGGRRLKRNIGQKMVRNQAREGTSPNPFAHSGCAGSERLGWQPSAVGVWAPTSRSHDASGDTTGLQGPETSFLQPPAIGRSWCSHLRLTGVYRDLKAHRAPKILVDLGPGEQEALGHWFGGQG